jgi:hypothetical protein
MEIWLEWSCVVVVTHHNVLLFTHYVIGIMARLETVGSKQLGQAAMEGKYGD